MKKGKRQSLAADPGIDAAVLEHRLEELLMVCEGIAVGMSNDFVFEVWGKLRFAPGAQMMRLSTAQGDLREAIRLALLAAREMEMPHLIRVRTGGVQ